MTKHASLARRSSAARFSFGGLSVNFRQLFARLAYACQLPGRVLGLMPGATTDSGFVQCPCTTRKKAGTLLAVGEKMRRVGEWVEHAVDLAVATSVGTSRHSGKPWAALEPLEPRQLLTTLYWDTSATAGLQGGSGTWASGTNWNTQADGNGSRVAWTNGADAVFSANGPGTITISSNVTANSMTFSGTGYVVTSGVLSLSGSAAITANQNAEIASTVVGTAGLAESGTGTLILSHSNGYSGTTTVAAGSTLQVGNASTTGSLGTGNVTNNGTLAFKHSGAITVSNVISGAGTLSQQGSGTLILTGANTYSGGTTINPGTVQVGSGSSTGSLGTGTITNYGALVVYRTGTVTISDVITGSGSLNNKGTGTLTLATSNTYTGITRVQAGVLRLGHSSAMYSSLVQLNATDSGSVSFGALTVATFGGLQGSRALTLSNTASQAVTLTVSTNTNNSYTYSGVLSGNGKLFVDGTGTLTLTGTNTFSGATTINTSSTLQVGSGGTTGSMGSGAITINGALRINTSGVVTLANQIYGAGPLTKVGTGTLTLSGNNYNFSGTTHISDGVLLIGANNILSRSVLDMNATESGTVSVANVSSPYVGGLSGYCNIIIPSGVTFYDTLYSGSSNFYGTLTGEGRLGVSGTGTLTLLGSNNYSGYTTVASPAVLQVGTGGTQGSVGTGPIQGSGKIVFNHTDSVTIGRITIATLEQQGTGTLVLTGTFGSPTTTIIGAGSTLQVGNGGTVGYLGDSAITNNGTLVIYRSGTVTLGGNISGSGSVLVEGSGTVSLTGSNSYTGATTVGTGSTLQVGNGTDGTLGTGDLTVNGSLIINEPNPMSIGNLSCGSGSLLDFVINATGSSGKLTVIGTISLTSTSLVLTGSRTLSASSSFTLIDNNRGTITPTFAGYLDGSLVTDTLGLRYDISYHGGGGHDVVVTDDPYPWVRTIQTVGYTSFVNASQVQYLVDFTRPVTGVTASDFTPATPIAGAQMFSLTGTDAEYMVTVNTGSSNGTLGLSLIDNHSIHSVAGALELGGTVNASYTSSSYYTLDRTAPTNLNATATSLTCVTLSWVDHATDETGFQVWRSTDGVSFSPLTLQASSANGVGSTVTYQDRTIQHDTPYWYKVIDTKNGTTPVVYSNTTNSVTAVSWTSSWNTSSTDSNWNASTNWSNGVPDAFCEATIGATDGITVTLSNSTAAVGSLDVHTPLLIDHSQLTLWSSAALDNANLQFLSGTLTGGTITPSGTASQLSVDNATFDGVTDQANTEVHAAGTLTVLNGLHLDGSLTIDGSDNVCPTDVVFLGSQALTGNGQIGLNGSRAGLSITNSGSAATLTIGSGITLHGQGAIVADSNCWILNSGTIMSDTDGAMNIGPIQNPSTIEVTQGTADLNNLNNTGTVSVTGAALNLLGNWTNVGGTITSTNGVLSLGGTVSTANLGTISRNGGTLNLVGMLNNAGQTLTLGDTGVWLVNGGTITGGMITASSSGTYLRVNEGTLDGVTLETNLTVNSLGSLTVKNGLTLTLEGTLTVQDSGYRDYHTTVDFQGTQQLGGTGEVFLTEKGAQLLTENGTAPGTLTIGSGITVHGQGNLAVGYGSTLTNWGTIIADTSKTLETDYFHNHGVVRAVSGVLTMWGVDNTGTLSLEGGSVNMWGNRTGGGTVTGGTVVSSSPVTLSGVSATSDGATDAITISVTGVPDSVSTVRILRDGQILADIPGSRLYDYGYPDHPLKPGTTYTYELVPYLLDGSVGQRSTITATTTADTTSPSAVSGLYVVSATSQEVTLRWSPVSDVGNGSGFSHYAVYRDNILIASPTEPSVSDLLPTSYRTSSSITYTVIAVDVKNNSENESSITVNLASAVSDPIAAENNQYVPQEYLDYFLRHIDARLPNTCRFVRVPYVGVHAKVVGCLERQSLRV